MFLNDSARRWQYVGDSTGLLRNDEEMQIANDLVTAWDSLYWEDGDFPDMNDTNLSFGSQKGLVRMMYEVFRDICGDFKTPRR